MSARFTLPPETVGLQPVRIDKRRNCFVNYEAVLFRRGWNGAEHTLRQFAAVGWLAADPEEYTGFALDALCDNGDILHTIPVTREGFRAIVRKWKCRVERDEVEL